MYAQRIRTVFCMSIFLCLFLAKAASAGTTTKPRVFEDDDVYFRIACEGGAYDAEYLRSSLKDLQMYFRIVQEELPPAKNASMPRKTFVEIRIVGSGHFAELLGGGPDSEATENVAAIVADDTIFLKSFKKDDDTGFKSALYGYVLLSFLRIQGIFPSLEETRHIVSAVDGRVSERKDTVSVRELASRR